MRSLESWTWEPAVVVDDHIPDGVVVPEEDDVDIIGEAIGLTYGTDEVLSCGEKERQRDLHRWELNPASSEDYLSRLRVR